jgi:Holliday junction resolvase RusA-like endonuclease
VSEQSLKIEHRRSLHFSIPGRLGAWQRGMRDSRQGASFTFTSAKMRSDKGLVQHYAVLAMRAGCKTELRGPLKMVVQTYRQPPRSWSLKKQVAAKWITSKPDVDNTFKLIADALNKIAYDDDAQIAAAMCLKSYRIIHPECVTVDLWELEP